ncbi:MAG TPA: porin family protein [Sunxiuqinia sp.]|nr:porin family protein [Sunxiuqinia sp.]
MRTKMISLFLLCLTVSSGVWAQNSNSGVIGGLNLSSMTTEGNNDKNLKAGFHIGVFDKIPVSESFAVQPELLYSVKGMKINYDGIAQGDTKFNLNYLELPVKLVFNLADDFDFHFGPYAGYLVNANMQTDAEVLNFYNINSADDINRKNFHPLDFGLVGGLGFDLDPVMVGFDYSMGLATVAKKDEKSYDLLGDAKNTVIQVYVGMKF